MRKRAFILLSAGIGILVFFLFSTPFGDAYANIKHAPSPPPERDAQGSAVHDPDPAGTITRLAQGLPRPFKEAIVSDIDDFIHLLGNILRSIPREYLLLVDKVHGVREEYIPPNLFPLDQFKGMRIKSEVEALLWEPAAYKLRDMLAASERDGKPIWVTHTYRSFARQKELFENAVQSLGYSATENYVAPPGHSQHNLGSAVDLYESLPGWLAENAAEYGFSLSYPEGYEQLTGFIYEPWHYRYLGVEACSMQKKFFGDIQYYLTWAIYGGLKRQPLLV